VSIRAARVLDYAEFSRPPCVELRIGIAGEGKYSGYDAVEDDVNSRNIDSPATLNAWRVLLSELTGELSFQGAERAGFISPPCGAVAGATMRTILRTSWKLPQPSITH
jgi:hypothetical protein